jgi:hypothetical protein
MFSTRPHLENAKVRQTELFRFVTRVRHSVGQSIAPDRQFHESVFVSLSLETLSIPSGKHRFHDLDSQELPQTEKIIAESTFFRSFPAV